MKAYSFCTLKTVSIWLFKQDGNVVATVSASRITSLHLPDPALLSTEIKLKEINYYETSGIFKTTTCKIWGSQGHTDED